MTHRVAGIAALLVFALALSGCGGGRGAGPFLPLPRLLGGGVAYEVQIDGKMDKSLRDLLQRSSELVTLQREPTPSRAALQRRVDGDLDNFRSVLRSEGYYDGTVQGDIDETGETAIVTLTVDPGPRYTLSSYSIEYTGDRAGQDTLPTDAAEFGAVGGMPARGPDVVAIQDALFDRLENTGRPLAAVEDRHAVVDHATRTMTVDLKVDPGPPTVFGPLTIEGLKDVEERYIRKLADWREGEVYDRRKVEEVRRTLSTTNLFRSVRLEEASQLSDGNSLPVTARLEEAKHRTIAAGINYTTAEGFGGELSWEHRNLSGRQERLRLSAQGSQIRQQAVADFRKPNFLQRDQTLVLTATGRAQQTDAFDERTGEIFAGLERKLGKVWTLGAGVETAYSKITENDVDSTFVIIGIPVTVSRNTTNDILDPTEGTKLQLRVVPYYAVLERTENFTVTELTGSAYFGIGERDWLVPAIRIRAGTIQGPATAEIPANRRFYAGGGGSVRGYEFQTAGPLDADNHPVGGRSVLETGLELRWRITNSFGLVPFVEGGRVFDASTPDFGENLFWAAGLGLRYFTIAGPIRLDVATPLNGRPGIDEGYQIYVSLGQAF